MRQSPRLTVGLLLAIGCSLPAVETSKIRQWRTLGDMGESYSRRQAAAAEVNGIIYIHGGLDFTGSPVVELWSFDPTQNEFSDISPAILGDRPDGRYDHGMVAFDTELHIFGGRIDSDTLSNEHWKFNPKKLKWSKMDSERRPAARALHAMAVAQNKIWIVGGDQSAVSKSDTWSWDPIAGWRERRSLTERSLTIGAAMVAFRPVFGAEERLLLCGGLFFDVTGNQCNSYNPDPNEWTLEEALPTSANRLRMVLTRTGILAFGGLTSVFSESVEPGWAGNKVYERLSGGGWQEMRLTSTAMMPSERADHVMIAPLEGEDVYLFGGIVKSDGKWRTGADAFQFSVTESRWLMLNEPSETLPPGRSQHGAVGLDNGMYVAGGEAADGSYLNDLWLLEERSLQWTQKIANGSGSLPHIVGHGMVNIGSKIYVFGGKFRNGNYSNSLHELDSVDIDPVWSEITATGDQPTARYRCAVAALRFQSTHRIFIWGGIVTSTGQWEKDKIYFMDPAIGLWKEQDLTEGGKAPPWTPAFFSYATHTVDGVDSILIHGGFKFLDNDIHYHSNMGDIYEFIPVASRSDWKFVKRGSSAQARRADATLVSLGHTIYLTGGRYGSNAQRGDLIAIETTRISDWKFTEIDAALRPDPRQNACAVSVNGKVFVFGGRSISSEITYNDIHIMPTVRTVVYQDVTSLVTSYDGDILKISGSYTFSARIHLCLDMAPCKIILQGNAATLTFSENGYIACERSLGCEHLVINSLSNSEDSTITCRDQCEGCSNSSAPLQVGGMSEVENSYEWLLDLSGFTFEDCRSNAEGGSIRIFGNATARISNSTFKGSHSQKGGGALGVLGSRVELEGVTFESCESTKGGAIFATFFMGMLSVDQSEQVPIASVITIKRCLFDRNTASDGDGGAIFTTFSQLTLPEGDTSTFELNNAPNGGGGAIYWTVERTHIENTMSDEPQYQYAENLIPNIVIVDNNGTRRSNRDPDDKNGMQDLCSQPRGTALYGNCIASSFYVLEVTGGTEDHDIVVYPGKALEDKQKTFVLNKKDYYDNIIISDSSSVISVEADDRQGKRAMDISGGTETMANGRADFKDLAMRPLYEEVSYVNSVTNITSSPQIRFVGEEKVTVAENGGVVANAQTLRSRYITIPFSKGSTVCTVGDYLNLEEGGSEEDPGSYRFGSCEQCIEGSYSLHPLAPVFGRIQLSTDNITQAPGFERRFAAVPACQLCPTIGGMNCTGGSNLDYINVTSTDQSQQTLYTRTVLFGGQVLVFNDTKKVGAPGHVWKRDEHDHVYRIHSCPPGHVLIRSNDRNRESATLDQCRPCSNGYYSFSHGDWESQQMVSETANDADQKCHPCPAGAECRGGDHFREKAGDWEENDGKQRLVRCDPGSVVVRNDEPSEDTCQSCPPGTYSLVSAVYSENKHVASSIDWVASNCTPCENGAVCAGGNDVTTQKGYWKWNPGANPFDWTAEAWYALEFPNDPNSNGNNQNEESQLDQSCMNQLQGSSDVFDEDCSIGSCKICYCPGCWDGSYSDYDGCILCEQNFTLVIETDQGTGFCQHQDYYSVEWARDRYLNLQGRGNFRALFPCVLEKLYGFQSQAFDDLSEDSSTEEGPRSDLLAGPLSDICLAKVLDPFVGADNTSSAGWGCLLHGFCGDACYHGSNDCIRCDVGYRLVVMHDDCTGYCARDYFWEEDLLESVVQNGQCTPIPEAAECLFGNYWPQTEARPSMSVELSNECFENVTYEKHLLYTTCFNHDNCALCTDRYGSWECLVCNEGYEIEVQRSSTCTGRCVRKGFAQSTSKQDDKISRGHCRDLDQNLQCVIDALLEGTGVEYDLSAKYKGERCWSQRDCEFGSTEATYFCDKANYWSGECQLCSFCPEGCGSGSCDIDSLSVTGVENCYDKCQPNDICRENSDDEDKLFCDMRYGTFGLREACPTKCEENSTVWCCRNSSTPEGSGRQNCHEKCEPRQCSSSNPCDPDKFCVKSLDGRDYGQCQECNFCEECQTCKHRGVDGDESQMDWQARQECSQKCESSCTSQAQCKEESKYCDKRYGSYGLCQGCDYCSAGCGNCSTRGDQLISFFQWTASNEMGASCDEVCHDLSGYCTASWASPQTMTRTEFDEIMGQTRLSCNYVYSSAYGWNYYSAGIPYYNSGLCYYPSSDFGAFSCSIARWNQFRICPCILYRGVETGAPSLDSGAVQACHEECEPRVCSSQSDCTQYGESFCDMRWGSYGQCQNCSVCTSCGACSANGVADEGGIRNCRETCEISPGQVLCDSQSDCADHKDTPFCDMRWGSYGECQPCSFCPDGCTGCNATDGSSLSEDVQASCYSKCDSIPMHCGMGKGDGTCPEGYFGLKDVYVNTYWCAQACITGRSDWDCNCECQPYNCSEYIKARTTCPQEFKPAHLHCPGAEVLELRLKVNRTDNTSSEGDYIMSEYKTVNGQPIYENLPKSRFLFYDNITYNFTWVIADTIWQADVIGGNTNYEPLFGALESKFSWNLFNVTVSSLTIRGHSSAQIRARHQRAEFLRQKHVDELGTREPTVEKMRGMKVIQQEDQEPATEQLGSRDDSLQESTEPAGEALRNKDRKQQGSPEATSDEFRRMIANQHQNQADQPARLETTEEMEGTQFLDLRNLSLAPKESESMASKRRLSKSPKKVKTRTRRPYVDQPQSTHGLRRRNSEVRTGTSVSESRRSTDAGFWAGYLNCTREAESRGMEPRDRCGPPLFDDFSDDALERAYVIRCPPSACDVNGQCRKGHYGPACGLCVPGDPTIGLKRYAASGSRCVECEDGELGILITKVAVFGGGGLLFMFLLWHFSWGPYVNFYIRSRTGKGLFEFLFSLCGLGWLWASSQQTVTKGVLSIFDWRNQFKTISGHVSSFVNLYKSGAVKTYLKLSLSFLQVTSTFNQNFNVEWPDVFLNYFDVATFFRFDLPAIPGPNCIAAEFSFEDKFFLISWFPALVILLLAIPIIILKIKFWLLPGKKKGNEWPFYQQMKTNFWWTLMFWIFLIYPQMCMNAVQTFNCEGFGDVWYLRSDFRLLCPEWPDWLFLGGVAATMAYPLGIPVFMYAVLVLHDVPQMAVAKLWNAKVKNLVHVYLEACTNSILLYDIIKKDYELCRKENSKRRVTLDGFFDRRHLWEKSNGEHVKYDEVRPIKALLEKCMQGEKFVRPEHLEAMIGTVRGRRSRFHGNENYEKVFKAIEIETKNQKGYLARFWSLIYPHDVSNLDLQSCKKIIQHFSAVKAIYESYCKEKLDAKRELEGKFDSIRPLSKSKLGSMTRSGPAGSPTHKSSKQENAQITLRDLFKRIANTDGTNLVEEEIRPLRALMKKVMFEDHYVEEKHFKAIIHTVKGRQSIRFQMEYLCAFEWDTFVPEIKTRARTIGAVFEQARSKVGTASSVQETDSEKSGGEDGSDKGSVTGRDKASVSRGLDQPAAPPSRMARWRQRCWSCGSKMPEIQEEEVNLKDLPGAGGGDKDGLPDKHPELKKDESHDKKEEEDDKKDEKDDKKDEKDDKKDAKVDKKDEKVDKQDDKDDITEAEDKKDDLSGESDGKKDNKDDFSNENQEKSDSSGGEEAGAKEASKSSSFCTNRCCPCFSGRRWTPAELPVQKEVAAPDNQSRFAKIGVTTSQETEEKPKVSWFASCKQRFCGCFVKKPPPEPTPEELAEKRRLAMTNGLDFDRLETVELLEELQKKVQMLEDAGQVSIGVVAWNQDNPDEKIILDRIGFIFDTYEVDYWWYELLEMGRKFLITSAIIFIYRDTPEQIAASFMITSAALIHFIRTQPFVDRKLDAFQVLALFIQSIELFYALMKVIQSMKNEIRRGEREQEDAAMVGMIFFMHAILIAIPFATKISDMWAKVEEYLLSVKKSVQLVGRDEEEHEEDRQNLHDLGKGTDFEDDEAEALPEGTKMVGGIIQVDNSGQQEDDDDVRLGGATLGYSVPLQITLLPPNTVPPTAEDYNFLSGWKGD